MAGHTIPSKSAGTKPAWHPSWLVPRKPLKRAWSPLLQLGDVFRLQTLWTFDHSEFDFLSFIQGTVTVALD